MVAYRIDNKFTFHFFVGIVMVICSILIGSRIASPFVSCFALDSQGRLYVGKHNRIDVYDNGILIDTITTRTSREYLFTIVEEDVLLLATSTTVYHMDTSGKIQTSFEDPTGKIHRQLKLMRKEFVSSQSDIYRLHNIWGWHYISKNESETIYSISLLSFLTKCLLFISAGLIVVCTLRKPISSKAEKCR